MNDKSKGPLLEFRNVSVVAQPPFDSGLDAISFVLNRGELALVRLEDHMTHIPLADAAQGLIDLKDGDVLYDGTSWNDMDAEAVSRNRARMGRVFEGYGWISNLDVDENITLAQRTHTRRDEAEIQEEARLLALAFQLDEIPRARPSLVPRAVLRRAQWVRAFMGQPKLILLERPSREMPDVWSDLLLKKVSEFRSRGTAFLWLTDAAYLRNHPAMNPSLKFEVRGTKMVPA